MFKVFLLSTAVSLATFSSVQAMERDENEAASSSYTPKFLSRPTTQEIQQFISRFPQEEQKTLNTAFARIPNVNKPEVLPEEFSSHNAAEPGVSPEKFEEFINTNFPLESNTKVTFAFYWPHQVSEIRKHLLQTPPQTLRALIECFPQIRPERCMVSGKDGCNDDLARYLSYLSPQEIKKIAHVISTVFPQLPKDFRGCGNDYCAILPNIENLTPEFVESLRKNASYFLPNPDSFDGNRSFSDFLQRLSTYTPKDVERVAEFISTVFPNLKSAGFPPALGGAADFYPFLLTLFGTRSEMLEVLKENAPAYFFPGEDRGFWVFQESHRVAKAFSGSKLTPELARAACQHVSHILPPRGTDNLPNRCEVLEFFLGFSTPKGLRQAMGRIQSHIGYIGSRHSQYE